MSGLEPRLATYIAARMPQAAEVAVHDLTRMSGGASRETYRFRLTWRARKPGRRSWRADWARGSRAAL